VASTSKNDPKIALDTLKVEVYNSFIATDIFSEISPGAINDDVMVHPY
jgi:hypothetical protein